MPDRLEAVLVDGATKDRTQDQAAVSNLDLKVVRCHSEEDSRKVDLSR